jgi:dTDP-glucose pyrophosphorylase
MQYKKHLILSGSSIKSALFLLDDLGKDAILFVVDKDNKLIASLTDGDIRRGLLKGASIDEGIDSISQNKPKYLKKGDSDIQKVIGYRNDMLKIVPVLDELGRIVDIVNFGRDRSYLPLDAVIMAGGKGMRLRPLTENTPKPLLKVGDKPIIEHNIGRLSLYGIKTLFISVNYLGEQIEDYFKDGSDINLSIKYLYENMPLGTIGAVSQIEKFNHSNILITNSDLLTNIDYEDFFLDFIKQEADFSVVSIPYNVNVPYAVLETNENCVISFKEKPTFTYYSNGGIYLIKKDLLKSIPQNTMYNATDLMEKLIKEGAKVITYPLLGYWLDIGSHEEFKKAQIEYEHIKF